MPDRRHLLLGLLGLAAARPASAQLGPPAAPQRLSALLDEMFHEALAESPETVTSLGLDQGERAAAKSKLHGAALADVGRRKALTANQLARLRTLPRDQLTGRSAIDYDVVLQDLETTEAANRRFAYGDEGAGNPYVLSQLNGLYQSAPDFLATQHTIETREDCEAYLARLSEFGRVMREEIDRVRHDAGLGVIPPDFAIKGALGQMKALREGDGLVSALADRARSKGIVGDWGARAAAAVKAEVTPALDAQMALLVSLLPKSSHDAGVWRLPDGEAYYAQALAAQTTTSMSPAEVHRTGLETTRELSARADVLFRRLGMTKGSVGRRYDALYKSGRGVYPDTDAAKVKLISDLNRLVQAMQARLPTWFATLPKTPLEIRRIPKATEQGASTHYTEGSLDGTRPGVYWINLRNTKESPFWFMPTTTFHEGVPGHHLQLTLQRQSDLPMYRKIQGFGAYAEGWALYAEQLAQEMGFYKGQPLWELGYIHDALLRSGRLVTDTGIHALRWSRERAIQALSAIDGDPLTLSAQEIERYAVWPGQACSYMLGKLTFLRLRDKAKAELGSRFDIRKFHDAMLLAGSMPLTVLGSVAERYVAEASGRAPA